MKLGIIGIVTNYLKDDLWGTLGKLRDLGYKGLEAAPITKPLEAGDFEYNMARFADMGMEVTAVGTSRQQLEGDVEGLIAEAKKFKTNTAVLYWSECAKKETVLGDAELYNKVGKRLADEGIKLHYHNHEHEFKNMIEGKMALDFLAANTDPRCLYFQVDVAWAWFGGVEPADVIKKLRGRVTCLHVKDLCSRDVRDLFTAVGTGSVTIDAAIVAAKEADVVWATVEQDKLRNISGMDTAIVSALNLRERGLI